jgi:hypothetical protein
MKMIAVVPLRYHPGNQWMHIRELCGKDEQSVAGARSIDALCLLDRILPPPGGIGTPLSPASLPVADRDRLLTAVYINTYGPVINTTVTCPYCKSKFDLGFTLDEWANDIEKGKKDPLNGKVTPYPFTTPGGIRFRLPTGDDELAVMGFEISMAEAGLLQRCIPEDTVKYDDELLQKAMQETAPLADREFEAPCPECGGKQWFHFNMQQYLLSSLLQEKETLVAEIHHLARYYGWGLSEILDLPRTLRKSYVNRAVAAG